MGLTGVKMSKSDPMSAIFMEDDAETVNTKVSLAKCVAKEIKDNAVVEYLKHIVFPSHGTFATASKVYSTYEEAEAAFIDGSLTPEELKAGMAAALNKILQPVRDHFQNDENAKNLLAQVRSFVVTK